LARARSDAITPASGFLAPLNPSFRSSLLRLTQQLGAYQVWEEGQDTPERDELTQRLPKGRRLGPVSGFVVPTLRRCGLLSERVAVHFHEFLRANLGSNLVGEDVEEFLERIPELPHDTAAWVLGQA
jgi:hypothetical protein